MGSPRVGSPSWAAAVAVAALLSTLSPPATADETEPPAPASVALAERRAADAFQAYTKKEYAAAIALYLEAYDAAPSGSILYNIARIYDLKVHNRPLAITFYRRYIADAGAQADLVELSNERLGELRGAEATAYKGTAEGSTLEGSTDPRGRGLSPPARSDTSPQRRRDWSTLRWIGVGVGAAGVAGVAMGGGFGLAAMSKAGTANDLCDGNACASQQGVDAAHAARHDATLSTIGFSAGGALLLAGAALFFLGEDPASRPEVHLQAHASASAAALQMVGTW